MDKILALLPIRSLLKKIAARYLRRLVDLLVAREILEPGSVTDDAIAQLAEFAVAELFEALEHRA